MKKIKQLFKNLILTTVILYLVMVSINIVDLLRGRVTDTDFWGIIIFTFIGAFIYSIIFVIVQGLLSLWKKNILCMQDNKVLILIPVVSSFLVEEVDFRWFGLIDNIDNALYLNFVLLCSVLLVVGSMFMKNKNENRESAEIDN